MYVYLQTEDNMGYRKRFFCRSKTILEHVLMWVTAAVLIFVIIPRRLDNFLCNH